MSILQTISQRLKVRYLRLQVKALQSWPMYEEMKRLEQELRREGYTGPQEAQSALKTK